MDWRIRQWKATTRQELLIQMTRENKMSYVQLTGDSAAQVFLGMTQNFVDN